jgi:hypothetical protein
MMAKTQTTESRLHDARGASAAATAKIREFETKRSAALLRDDDEAAATILVEIERLRVFARNAEEKARLLLAEAKKEEALRHSKENEAKIKRIEGTLAAREAIAAELVTVFARANELALEMLALNHKVDAAWPWTTGDLFALLLHRNAVVAALKHEQYRLSAIPRLGGGQQEGVNAGWKLPGSEPPRYDLVHRPKSIPSLVSVLRDASSYGSAVMRGHRTPATAAPAQQKLSALNFSTPDTVTPTKLSALLERQHELAALDNPSPAQEAEYGEVIKQIAMLETETPANAK